MATINAHFRLLRYFSIASAAITVLMTVAVVLIYQAHQTSTLLRTAEDQNVSLAKSFANTIWSQHGEYLLSVGDLDGDALRARPETAEINQALQNITKDLPVLKVKIFNLSGTTLYSSDFAQIGETKADNAGFLTAVTDSKPASKISYRGTFSAFSGMRANVHLAESYVPIIDDAGKVKSVFELYTDVTPDITSLQDDTWSAAILAIIASGGFYLVLLLVVRRADITIRRQHEELSSFNEQLKIANARLDAALENMSHGIAMFDDQGRLVMFNEKYPQVYGLPHKSVKPGMDLRSILELRVASGCVPVDNLHEFVEQPIERTKTAEVYDRVVELTDNRFVAVAHRPLPEGGWVSTHEDVTHRKHAEAQVAHMALHDAMTELPNRVKLRDEMSRALACWRQRNEKSALLMLDLDGFKAVNDTHGHMAGDDLLKQVGARLRGCAGETGVVARLGGDEFAILKLNVVQPDDAAALASSVIAALSQPFTLGDVQVTVGVSVGIALVPEDGDEANLLLRNADLALYRSKIDGKGRYCFFEAAMDLAVHERRRLELDLRDAYRNGEFELFYQPILRFDTGEVSAFEALIRWNHPQRGVIGPVDFITTSEEIGLVGFIGDWVIRQACQHAAHWPQNIRVAVNLSPRQFAKDSNLVQTVMSALASSRLSPDRLELEITENVLIADDEASLRILRQLRDLGVSIALDDFGTGYSSLGYLRRFPFDKIKIDRSFVRDMATNKDSRAIVRAVLDLATSLGMKTVGEGVETTEQLNQLRAMGCAEVQGYLLSEPKPGHEIDRLILNCNGLLAKAA